VVAANDVRECDDANKDKNGIHHKVKPVPPAAVAFECETPRLSGIVNDFNLVADRYFDLRPCFANTHRRPATWYSIIGNRTQSGDASLL
jgi:hypothetical protein